MTVCSIVNCSNTVGRDKHVSYHRIPAIITRSCDKTLRLSTERRALWIARINRAELIHNEDKLKRAVVCGRHFVKGRPSDLFDETNVDWAPTLDLGYDDPTRPFKRASAANERHKRAKERKKQNVPYEQASTSYDEQNTGSPKMEMYPEPFEEVICEVDQNMDICLCNCHHDEAEKVDSSCQTDVSGDIQEKEESEKQVEQLKTQVSQLNQVLASMQLELRETKEKIHDLVLFTPEKLKQPSSEPMIKYYTGLPTYKLLKFIFKYVSKEVPADTHRNSLMPLQECVMFLMRLRLNVTTTDLGFRFNVSLSTACRMFHKWLDMMYTKLKPVLGNIPNDSVLTGLSFNVAENLGYINAILILPSLYTKKQCQPVELLHSELAKESSKLRIQVDKVIGHVKQKYKILSGPVSSELLGKDKNDIPYFDKIITVAYVLTNLNDNIVSQM